MFVTNYWKWLKSEVRSQFGVSQRCEIIFFFHLANALHIFFLCILVFRSKTGYYWWSSLKLWVLLRAGCNIFRYTNLCKNLHKKRIQAKMPDLDDQHMGMDVMWMIKYAWRNAVCYSQYYIFKTSPKIHRNLLLHFCLLFLITKSLLKSISISVCGFFFHSDYSFSFCICFFVFNKDYLHNSKKMFTKLLPELYIWLCAVLRIE